MNILKSVNNITFPFILFLVLYFGSLLSPFNYKTGTMGRIGSPKLVLPKWLSYGTLNRVIRVSSNVSTTPVTAMGYRQCLPLSVVQLKGKHCRKPHYRNGVVDMFGPGLIIGT